MVRASSIPMIRVKALAYLREQRVRILVAMTRGAALRPEHVEAIVRGHKGDYLVRFDHGEWSCTCPNSGCPHLAAVQLVTGWPSAAAKDSA